MKLYNEMKSAMASIIEAEENAAAWKKEAASRTKNLNNLIRAEEIASGVKLDRKTVHDQLRAEFITDEAEAETPAEDEPGNLFTDRNTIS